MKFDGKGNWRRAPFLKGFARDLPWYVRKVPYRWVKDGGFLISMARYRVFSDRGREFNAVRRSLLSAIVR